MPFFKRCPNALLIKPLLGKVAPLVRLCHCAAKPSPLHVGSGLVAACWQQTNGFCCVQAVAVLSDVLDLLLGMSGCCLCGGGNNGRPAYMHAAQPSLFEVLLDRGGSDFVMSQVH